MLISDLLARSAVTSHNHKLRTKLFWRHPDQVVRTGPRQWVAKTQTKARIWRPAAGKCWPKYLFACHPDPGWQETAGQPISHQSPKLQSILVHIYIYRLRRQNQRTSFQFHYGNYVCHVCKQNAHGAV